MKGALSSLDDKNNNNNNPRRAHKSESKPYVEHTNCPFNRTFDPEDPICHECGDFDYCCLEWLEEPNENKRLYAYKEGSKKKRTGRAI